MANPLALATKGKSKNGSKKRKKNTGALQKSEQQVARLQNKIKALSGKAGKSMEVLAYSAATQASLGATAYATGRWGTDKLSLGALDGRLALGGGLLVGGLISAYTGKAEGASGTMLAVGNGVLGAWVYEMGHDAGAKSKKGSGFGYDYDEGNVPNDFGREVHATADFGRGRPGLRRR